MIVNIMKPKNVIKINVNLIVRTWRGILSHLSEESADSYNRKAPERMEICN